MANRLVENLAKRGCITIQKNSKISELVDVLSLHNIGAVVVTDKEKKPIGMVSERDIVRNYKNNVYDIKDIMSTNPKFIKLIELDGLGHMPQFEDYSRFSDVFYPLFK